MIDSKLSTSPINASPADVSDIGAMTDTLLAERATLMSLMNDEVDVDAIGAATDRLIKARNDLSSLVSGVRSHQKPDSAKGRIPQSDVYSFDENRTKGQRKKDNAAAIKLLKQIDGGEVNADSLTDEDRRVLARYSGTGGALVGADGKKGSAYEYYTPKPIAEGVWELLGEIGFSGGKVLDPCAGVGIFGATAPSSAVVDSVELNQTSGRINALVNNGPGYKATVFPFEAVASAVPDNTYDAVVTNVPFGDVADRGGNQFLDNRYQDEPIQNYFILRSLEKLRPGGLAAFIVPPRCVSGRGGKEEELRRRTAYLAEFLGAYRLPNTVFGTASADTITDLIVFRKYGADAAEKISELREQSPDTLMEASVIWPPFIDGKYFETEGKRFVLGEFKPRDPEAFRDVDRVINPAKVSDIAKMMRKFPDSRINWELLNATETLPIIYADGDTVTQAGETLEMRNGAWVARPRPQEYAGLSSSLARMPTPYTAFENGVTWSEAISAVNMANMTSKWGDIPQWLSGVVAKIKKLSSDGERGQFWKSALVGLSVKQVLDENSGEPTNFLEEFPSLSIAMMSVATARVPPVLSGPIKNGIAAVRVHYSKKGGYSSFWRGDVLEAAPVMSSVADTAEGRLNALRYESKSPWVSLDKIREILGDGFDPMADDGWCIALDGKSVIRADDYFSGNYAAFLSRIDADIASAEDEAVRNKLLRQKMVAGSRISRVDPAKMTFNLMSPFITMEEKVDFLRRFVDPSVKISVDDDGLESIRFNTRHRPSMTMDEKLLSRFTWYLNNGTISLGGMKFGDDGSMRDTALARLQEMIETANSQLTSWVKSNPDIMARLTEQANDPKSLHFDRVDDESLLTIPGMNPSLKLHGYQNAYVRKMGREFGGLNGFGVGLGKTFTALAAVQYVQSVGVKKKTIFVLPNSVMSNWWKESRRAYASVNDCLYVGLREDGDKAVVKSSLYDDDLNSIMENRHSKIFMTYEAFARLRLKDDTINDYLGYLEEADSSFAESSSNKVNERRKSRKEGIAQVLSAKAGSAPYLEDLGIDSLVIDEAHSYKNSADVEEFSGGKFLALPKSSTRGVDMQAKAWYVRGLTDNGDGILPLTATPITNSPLEIFSMLSLTVGRERVSSTCLGVKSVDEFMAAFCRIESQPEETCDGEMKLFNTFTGLENLAVLRKLLGEVVEIKDAADVGAEIIVPERDEKPTPVTLSADGTQRLMSMKLAYRHAISLMKKKKTTPKGQAAFESLLPEYRGMSVESAIKLIGHPFNLLSNMQNLIADEELGTLRASVYYCRETDLGLATDAVDAFNALSITEKRDRLGAGTRDDDVVKKTTAKKSSNDDDDGSATVEYVVRVRATIHPATAGTVRITVDSTSPETQEKFERLAAKHSLSLDVSVPPKLAAMLENFKSEQEHPRGIASDGAKIPFAKQIIYCDVLALHNKIKIILAKHAGVNPAHIVIVTGKTNGSAEDILDVQNGFNANGDENRYRVVIANEKAEVGINLQQGTQAIHHLTIGWTPDSLEQRNGRGVRQGNATGSVSIYHYDADGTFDRYKRNMVNRKSEWISQLMDVNGEGYLTIEGGMSREKMELLIDSIGDADAMTKIEEGQAALERRERIAKTRRGQTVLLDTMMKAAKSVKDNETPDKILIARFEGLSNRVVDAKRIEIRIIESEKTLQKAQAALEDAKTDADKERPKNIIETQKSRIASLQEKKAAIDAQVNALASELDASVTIKSQGETISARDYVKDPSYASSIKWVIARGDMVILENGPISSEWQAEIASAKAMIDQAAVEFSALSNREGGIPVSVMNSVRDGAGRVVSGVPIVPGSFIRDGGALLCIESDLDLKGVGKSNNEQWSTLSYTTRREGEWVAKIRKGIIYEGTADYDECLTLAASIEDEISNQRKEDFSLYSEIVPSVKPLRSAVFDVEYRNDSVTLPPPYFPVVPRVDEDSSDLVRKIAEQQRPIVKSNGGKYGSGYFVTSSDVAVERSRPESAVIVGMIADFAKANGHVIVSDDISAFSIPRQSVSDFLNRALLQNEDKVFALMREGESLGDAAIKFAQENIIPWDRDSVVVNLSESICSMKKHLPDDLKGEDASSPDDTVALSGKTFPIKDDIKDWQRRYGVSVGGDVHYSVFDGDSKSWFVHRQTWEKMERLYPDKIKGVIVNDVDPSHPKYLPRLAA